MLTSFIISARPAVENLDYYIAIYHTLRLPNDYLFYTLIKGTQDSMSVANTERFIKKYGESARKICTQVPEAVHPHLFRHSYGAHLYRMGFSLPLIAKLLDELGTKISFRIRGNISTARKNGVSAITAFRDSLMGRPYIPES